MGKLLKFLKVLLSNTPEQMSMPAFLPWRDLRAQEEQVYPPHLDHVCSQGGGVSRTRWGRILSCRRENLIQGAETLQSPAPAVLASGEGGDSKACLLSRADL